MVNGERQGKANMENFHWPQKLSEIKKMNSKVMIYILKKT